MVGGRGGHGEMIVKLWKGKTEPAPCLSWKECSRLGKPQVYGPGSDNSHEWVVKTAPKFGWQGWQKRFTAEDPLSAKDAAFLSTPPSATTDGPLLRGAPTCKGVTCPESHSQEELGPEPSALRQAGHWAVPAAVSMEAKPAAQRWRPERPSPMAGTVYFGWYILKRKWTYRKWNRIGQE